MLSSLSVRASHVRARELKQLARGFAARDGRELRHLGEERRRTPPRRAHPLRSRHPRMFRQARSLFTRRPMPQYNGPTLPTAQAAQLASSSSEEIAYFANGSVLLSPPLLEPVGLQHQPQASGASLRLERLLWPGEPRGEPLSPTTRAHPADETPLSPHAAASGVPRCVDLCLQDPGTAATAAGTFLSASCASSS